MLIEMMQCTLIDCRIQERSCYVVYIIIFYIHTFALSLFLLMLMLLLLLLLLLVISVFAKLHNVSEKCVPC